MPTSMTGFGRAELRFSGQRLLCEIRSVNHRYLSPKFRLGSLLTGFEPWLHKRIQDSMHRGAIDLYLSLQGAGDLVYSRLSESTADRYLAQIRSYLKGRRLSTEVGLELLLQLPGVFVASDSEELAERIKPRVEKVFETAFTAILKMRAREGARLLKALERELSSIFRAVRAIRALGPEVLKTHSRRLSERVNLLLVDSSLKLDEATLAREVAIQADRCDITEEIDRLDSHGREMEATLLKAGPIGRSLEFLVQEMSREMQTIGSKSQDQRVTRQVLKAKSSLERIREQVQNLE